MTGDLPSTDHAEGQAQELLDGYRNGAGAARRRFARSHPRFDRPVADATLGDARFVVAREHGFDDWQRFRVSAEAAATPANDRVSAFLDCGWAWGDRQRAQALLAMAPDAARADLYAACVLGAADEVAERLSRRPDLARLPGGPRRWPPLLYVCWSGFLAWDPRRSEGLLRTARLLLDHGADPNCFWHNAEYDANETALYGACGVANHAGMTELLLEAGADPNDGESLYHACEHFDTACLELLYAHGVDRDDLSYNLKHVIDYRYDEGVRWFLSRGADPDQRHPASGETALHWAVKRGFGPAVIELLLDHGADVHARTGRRTTAFPSIRARTAHDVALRLGQTEVAGLLERRGARPSARDAGDELVVACARGDGERAAAILTARPHAVARLHRHDKALMATVAQMNNADGVRVMAEAGFDVDAAGWMDATPLHWAACRGNPAMAAALLAHGARPDVDAPAMAGPPLGTAIRRQWNPAGDYAAVIRLLLQAGSPVPEGVYPTGQPAIDALLGRQPFAPL